MSLPAGVTLTKVTYDIQFTASAGFDKVPIQITIDTSAGLTSTQIDTITADGSLFEQGLYQMAQTIINNSGGIVTGVTATKRYDGYSAKTIA